MIDLKKNLILASGSPRRQQLLSEMFLNFEILPADVEEIIPDGTDPYQAAEYLAGIKADYHKSLWKNNIILAADTTVILEGKIYNKPENEDHAVHMLEVLSGKTHEVVTGVCIATGDERISFSDTTRVSFAELSRDEIDFYLKKCKPFDKAGAYGAQDWLGLVGIEKLEGSYFTVMGLPVHLVYRHFRENF